MARAPALFLSHGAPLLAIDPERGAPFRALGASLPALAGIIVVSSHWETPTPAVGTTTQRPLIHDYTGFPEALREVTYPAPCAPELANAVAARVPGLRPEPSRGWDHGVWTPLVHLLPEADVPVLQVSLPREGGPETAWRLGQALAPLRDEGVAILGSGSLTHHLGKLRLNGGSPDAGATSFDTWVVDTLTRRDLSALRKAEHRRDFKSWHPSPEHWRPLLVAAGASSPADTLDFPIEGWDFANLSWRAVRFS